MTAVTDTLEQTSNFPALSQAFASATVAYNTAERGSLAITVTDRYKSIKLIQATITGLNAASNPAYADGEVATIAITRGGQDLYPEVQSKPMALAGQGSASPTRTQWNWHTYDIMPIPWLLPGDVIVFVFPAIDDDAMPAADINYQISYYYSN